MPIDSLLEIPEIRHLICSYLANRDLARFVRVSKGWHSRFLPILWRTIKLRTSKRGFCLPYPSYIYHHRHLIHDLTFPNGPPGYGNFQYPILRSLTISCDGHPQGRDISLDITEMFPLLAELSLKHMIASPATWSTLSRHHHCRKLKLDSCKLKVEGLSRFWAACTKLRSLELHSVITAERGVPAGVVLSRISRLHVSHIKGWDGVSQLDLFLRCPHLKDMSWRAELSRNDPIHQQMTKLIQRDQWPCLETLNIAIDFEDTVLAAIIERAGNPSEIILTARLFGNHSFKQLGYHFGNLMHLDLWSCLPTSSMVRNILSGCPRLKTLKAGNIYARDIAQGRLCCLQLRELKICIVIEKSEQDLHRVIFERLSTLVHLEHLQLGYPGENELGNHHGLQFRLDLGMGQLRSLRQLKGVSFVNDIPACRLHPQIGKEEAEWIVENWKNLKRIKGELNSDKAEDRRSKDLLAQHGIDVAGPGAPSSSDSE